MNWRVQLNTQRDLLSNAIKKKVKNNSFLIKLVNQSKIFGFFFLDLSAFHTIKNWNVLMNHTKKWFFFFNKKKLSQNLCLNKKNLIFQSLKKRISFEPPRIRKGIKRFFFCFFFAFSRSLSTIPFIKLQSQK